MATEGEQMPEMPPAQVSEEAPAPVAQVDEQPPPAGEVGEAPAPVAEEPKKNWGGWGSLPPGFEEHPTEAVERPAAPLLDELAHEEITEETETVEVTGPDGYKYPPLTKAGADVLQRLWGNQLPANREEAVKLWEGRVRVAVQIGLAIPQAPRMPAQELLMRPAAERTGTTNVDMSLWAQPEEEEESPEMQEWREAGEKINPETVSKMLEKRFELRAQRSFKEADAIRNDLSAMGVEWNDVLKRWRCEGQEGTFETGAVPTSNEPPIELQDIDMPGKWEEFLQLPDPKVLAVGPRCPPNGKRAWGAGGKNWGTHDDQAAVDQAMNNCAQQGVNRPKIIWPPHLCGISGGGKGFGGGGGFGGFGGGGGGFQKGDKGGKGGGKFEGGKFGGKGGKFEGGGKYGDGGKYGNGGKYGKGGKDGFNGNMRGTYGNNGNNDNNNNNNSSNNNNNANGNAANGNANANNNNNSNNNTNNNNNMGNTGNNVMKGNANPINNVMAANNSDLSVPTTVNTAMQQNAYEQPNQAPVLNMPSMTYNPVPQNQPPPANYGNNAYPTLPVNPGNAGLQQPYRG
ncbi:hypothetical protein DIPPA_31376 [Diplonema papillatum]|nr:hypothetical protein DIPPA_31376 [Diplonema papillatum]